MRIPNRYGSPPTRSLRELTLAVIGWRGTALAKLMGQGRGQTDAARSIKVELEDLRERLNEMEPCGAHPRGGA